MKELKKKNNQTAEISCFLSNISSLPFPSLLLRLLLPANAFLSSLAVERGATGARDWSCWILLNIWGLFGLCQGIAVKLCIPRKLSAWHTVKHTHTHIGIHTHTLISWLHYPSFHHSGKVCLALSATILWCKFFISSRLFQCNGSHSGNPLHAS